MHFFKISKIIPYVISLIAPLLLTALLFTVVFIAERNSVAIPSSSNSTNINSSSDLQSNTDVPKALVITSPESTDITVTEPQITFTGKCEPDFPLTVNGNTVECTENGEFSCTFELQIGDNTFKFEHKDETAEYKVRYRYIVISSYSPEGSLLADGSSVLQVTATARKGSVVTAEFNGHTQTMTVGADVSEDFCSYSTSFNIPASQSNAVNLGKVKFTGTYNDITETFYSGNITCKAIYVPQIAEVVTYAAETFDGNTKDDYTRPTNNYLPKGTVDYVTGTLNMKGPNSALDYYYLRCGRRVYKRKYMIPGGYVTATKVYEGYLPDHNEIKAESVTLNDRYTIITFNTMWKAPFFLDLLPQRYTNPTAQDYTVSSFTAEYVEIKFCYATVFEGEINISADDPLFSHAEINHSDNGYFLRLYLKKKGAFYGWDCYYDSSDNLVFEFKHPVKGTATDENSYGTNLSGITIMVDAGHGGKDPGALGSYNGTSIYEKTANLTLANKIKTELESMGAKVIMLRTDDGETLTSDDRILRYRNAKPDFLVSVHHNSFTNKTVNGFGSYYTTPFSMTAAKAVFDRTMATNLYSKTSRTELDWHYFYMSRMTYCPSVLTENGYISSTADIINIASDDKNTQKAQAIAQGIADYFLSIN